MKLTYADIAKVASRDKRIELIIDCRSEDIPSVIVWLDPLYTWNAADGNVGCRVYNVEGSDEYQDTLKTFKSDMNMVELAI